MQPMSVSCTDLAHLLCVTPGRVAQLVQTGIFPRPKVRGQYSVEVYVRIFIQHMRQDRADLVAQRTRWVKAKADKSELELRVRQGELTEVAKVQRQAFAVGRQVRDALQAVARSGRRDRERGNGSGAMCMRPSARKSGRRSKRLQTPRFRGAYQNDPGKLLPQHRRLKISWNCEV